jgi:ABC-2 type transport system ATP-binding protein
MVEEGSKSLMQVVRVLDQNKIEIADISLRRPSLDDVFLSMTAEEEESKKND